MLTIKLQHPPPPFLQNQTPPKIINEQYKRYHAIQIRKAKFFYNNIMEAEPTQYADQYEIHSPLGDGGQASVYLGSKDGQTFALKIYASGASKEAAYRVESEFLGKLKHPNLINQVDHRLQAKFRLNNRQEEKRPLIVLELAEGGELFDYISKTGRFTPEMTRTYARQMISAIAYLSDVGITHRDLKPENILFDRSFTLKISDFGLARDSKGDHGDQRLTSRVGTQGYKAPEMEAGDYEGLKVDIFAIGVILFIMYTGTPPFVSTRSHDRIYRLITERRYAKFWELHEKNKPPGFYSEAFKRLINSFLSAEPDRRPTFESLNADEWLNGYVLTNEELCTEMSARATRIGLKTFLEPLELVKICKEGYRSGVDLEDPTVTREDIFSHYYHNTHIQLKELPEASLKNVVYVNKQPKMVVSWIHCFLFQQLKDNNPFLPDFVEQIKFAKYDLTLEGSQLRLTLDFEIENEDETELVLLGSLHQSGGKVGIEWVKSEGNSFWLSAIKEQINQSFNNLN